MNSGVYSRPRSNKISVGSTASSAIASAKMAAASRRKQLPPANSVGNNVNVSNEAGPQSETDIAIDPTNPNHIVGGFERYRECADEGLLNHLMVADLD